jgi:RNase H-like domain found in reverse transcriptase/Reverse transcriptase (RNA-dependent DNA polymerase)/Retroviral aspartyl protease
MVAGRALIDSGATENFIDYRTVVRWRVNAKDLRWPRKVYNVDGTENQGGIISKSCVLHVQRGERQLAQRFYVTNLGQDRIILGYPWLREFNPDIDWEEGRLISEEVKLEEIGMAWEGYKEWQQRIRIHKTHFTQEWAIKNKEQQWQESVEEKGIPQEYQWHGKVFSDQQATRFLPSRPEDHAIKLIPGALETISCKVYPLTLAEQEVTKKFLEENEQLGYIEKTDLPWLSLWFFIKKKDGMLRPVQDYREVNKWTVRDVYPILRIEQILESLNGKELFTVFDIQMGYNNVLIKKEDRWKAAFKTPYGLYQPKVMFFGLMNSPATFQWTIDWVFWHLRNKYPGMIFVYMDDILIVMTKDYALHRQVVHEVLEVLEGESFFLKPAKCKFKQESIDYLGIVVTKGTIWIDPTKQDGLAAWPCQLTSVKQVRSTLGVLGYQRPFIHGFAQLARPLTQLLKKDRKFEWTDECTTALNELIKIVTSDPVLHRPNYNLPFTLEVDASQYATGAILYQPNDKGRLCPVGYHSHTLNLAKRGYDVHDRELLAVMRGLRQWRHLLLLSPFTTTVIMDHANLQYYC